MRKIGFLILAALSFSVVYAQSVDSDSLKEMLSRIIHPEKKFELTQQLAYNAVITGQMEKALSYNKTLFDIATTEKSDSLLMLAYTATAAYWNYKTDPREVIEYSLRAVHIPESRYKTSLPELHVLLSSGHYAPLAREATPLIRIPALKCLLMQKLPSRIVICY